jgi:hypothetical protein
VSLKFINLQVDADPQNPWVKDYITIAKYWEEVAERFNTPIEGLITPYGLNARVKLLLPGFNEFTVEIDKQLENIKSSPMSMKSWPICARIKAHFGYLTNSQAIVLRNSIWNILWGWLRGYRIRTRSSLVYMEKRSFQERKSDLTFLEHARDFQSLTMGPEDSMLHLLYIPSSHAELEDFLELCKKIKTAANKTYKQYGLRA